MLGQLCIYITDKQWALLEPKIPEAKSLEGVGRPPSDFRRGLDGILWILRTGAPWKDLPERYGAKSVVYRWFQNWRKQDVMEQMLRTLAEDLIGNAAPIDTCTKSG